MVQTDVPLSLQDQLRAARLRALHETTQDFEIPGTAGTLWGTFKALDDYREVREIVKSNAATGDEAEQEMNVAADTLVRSCVGVYAKDPETGEIQQLDMGLGVQLAEYYGETVDTDRQAVFAIFPGTVSIVTLFAQLEAWFAKTGRKATGDLAGNSPAQSTLS